MFLVGLAAVVVAVGLGVGGYGLSVVSHYRHQGDDIYLDVGVALLAITLGIVARSLWLRRPVSATPAPSRLESWLQGRIQAAAEIARQRVPRGEDWYRKQMGEWDVDNCMEMHEGEDPVAPELVDNYRRSPTTGLVDGPGPPHDAAEYDRYYGERLAWCRNALSASSAGTPIVAPLKPKVPEAHRLELQAIAEGLQTGALAYERAASYHPPSKDGTVLVADSFRTHFPALARMLDEWDGRLLKLEQGKHELWHWIDEHWDDRADPSPPVVLYGHVVEAGQTALPWVINDWLMLGPGHGIAQITDGRDVDAVKRPYDELLAEVLATDLARELRAARQRVDQAKAIINQQLDFIQAQHAIRGTCDLCVAVGN